MSVPTPSPAPLLRDLIDIPERVSAGDFVLRLVEGIDRRAQTLDDYVVTDQLVSAFDQALGLIDSAISSRTSKGSYLHGSFGSGKSHFMAVLDAILAGDATALAIPQLARVIAKYPWLGTKKLLLVPQNLISAESLEAGVLGGYLDYITEHFPAGTPLPAVLRSDGLLADLRVTRDREGRDAFAKALQPVSVDGRWGSGAQLAAAGMTADEVDAALDAPSNSALARTLLSIALPVYFPHYAETVAGAATAYVPIDTGLSEIARHARSLGYDAVVLFLDELVLWLAGLVINPELQFREIDKVAKLVESNDAARDVPIISFIARQRNLRELIGPNGTGAETLAFEDRQKYWEERFGTIPLEDRNLQAIASHRVLRPRGPDELAQIDRAFDRTDALPTAQREVLVGGEDRAAFRATYPFTPTFLEVLVHVSSALQRERTALRLMQQLLVNHRDDLHLGELVPLGDLWDALADGVDSPFSERLGHEFRNARDLYARSLRPTLLELDGVTDSDVRAALGAAPVAEGAPAVDPVVSAKVRTFRGDDRLIKTLLIAALVPEVQALRGLTVRRLVALNPGAVRSPIRGQEPSLALTKLKALATRVGQLRVGDGDDPTVSLQLVGVDTVAILERVPHADSAAERRRWVRARLMKELGVVDTQRLMVDRTIVWRGTERSVELVYGNVRDPADLSDEQFEPAQGDAWRIILDYPFDVGEHSAADDRSRLIRLREKSSARCVVWLPAFFTEASLRQLGTLLRIEHVLSSGRLGEYTRHLGDSDRERAHESLDNQRSALVGDLTATLSQAYGLRAADDGKVQPWTDHLVSRMPGNAPRLDVGRPFDAALVALGRQLYDDTYRDHPRLVGAHEGEAVRTGDLKTGLALIRTAAEDPDKRLDGLDSARRSVLKRILVPLHLGHENDGVFVLDSYWSQELSQKIAAQGLGTSGAPGVSVRQLRTWLEVDGIRGTVADLVITSFAELSGRGWYRSNGPVSTAEGRGVDIGTLTDDMTLRPQELPSTAEWALARDRAGALFGVPFRSSALTARLLEQIGPVGELARSRYGEVVDLVDTLDRFAERLGLDRVAADGRYAVTVAARDLLADLRGRKSALELTRSLAAASSKPPFEWLGTTVTSAAGLAGALRAANWSALDSMRADDPGEAAIREALVRAANASEFATPLARRLQELDREAVQALVRRNLIAAPAPSPANEPSPSVTRTPTPTPIPSPTSDSAPTATVTVHGVHRAGAITLIDEFFRDHPDAAATITVTQE
jgi:hypothetical protein